VSLFSVYNKPDYKLNENNLERKETITNTFYLRARLYYDICEKSFGKKSLVVKCKQLKSTRFVSDITFKY